MVHDSCDASFFSCDKRHLTSAAGAGEAEKALFQHVRLMDDFLFGKGGEIGMAFGRYSYVFGVARQAASKRFSPYRTGRRHSMLR